MAKKPTLKRLLSEFELDPSFLLTARAGNSLAIGADLEARHIYLIGEVNSEQSAKLIVALNILNMSEGPIRITMNCPGGSVYDGLAMYDAIKLSRNPVIVVGTGHVMSMGTIIFQAADMRYLTPDCRFMIHDGSWGMGDNIHSSVLIASGKEMEAINKRCDQIFAERSGKDVKLLRKLSNRETYLSAKDTVKLGLADRLLTDENLREADPFSYIEQKPVRSSRRKKKPTKKAKK